MKPQKAGGDWVGTLRTLMPGESAVCMYGLMSTYGFQHVIPGAYKARIVYDIEKGAAKFTPISLEKWVDLEIVD